MSTHTRKGSPYIQGMVSIAGKQLTRSTGIKDRVVAKQVVEAGQRLAGVLESGERNAAVLLRFAAGIFDCAGVRPPWEKTAEEVSFKTMCDIYVDRMDKRGGVQPIVLTAIKEFTKSMSPGTEFTVSSITPKCAQDWYDKTVRESSSGTARNKLTALSGIMSLAARLGHIEKNPFACVDQVPVSHVVDKLPMPDADFEKLIKHLRETDRLGYGSWHVAAMLGRYAGLRLVDAAKLTYDRFSVVNGVMLLTFAPGKTKDMVCVPVVPQLREFIERQVGNLCCPMLHSKKAPKLSDEFREILELAGIEVPVVEHGSRIFRQITFHSLRHRFVQWLTELDIPMADRMKLSAHESASSHKIYEHAKLETQALNLFNSLKQLLPTSNC